MDEDLYDEFGNYIGPDLDQQDEEEDNQQDEFEHGDGNASPQWEEDGIDDAVRATAIVSRDDAANAYSSAVVLHEDKKYYPSAEEVYGDAEVLVQDEDTQPLTKPIIAPMDMKVFSVLEKTVPSTTYSMSFLTGLMNTPQLNRNVAVFGHLHHGKTAFCDMLIEFTHETPWNPNKCIRYTDSRKDEQERGLSIKATPFTVLLPSLSGKSHLFNIIDTPGHVNFSDEVTASFRAVDGGVVVIDAVEGVMLNTEKLLKHAVTEGLPLVLVINKIDRLILELKLPPQDAYYKLLHTIQEANKIVAAFSDNDETFSPLHGNVVFASSLHGWSFSLESFSKMYCEKWASGAIDYRAFASRLWGDVYYSEHSRRFHRGKKQEDGASRTFVHFVLEPIYKIYSQVLGEESKALSHTLEAIGVRIKKSELHLDAQPLLKLIFRQFLGTPSGFVQACLSHIPSPVEGNTRLLERYYTASDGEEVTAMKECDANGLLMINVVKLLPSPDATTFLALSRVVSGTLSVGQPVKVLGEAYTTADDEDAAIASVSALSIGQARYRVDVTSAPAGSIVLIEGVDSFVKKTATITHATPECAHVSTFKPLRFNTQAVVNLAVEPLNPSELPKMVAGLRSIQKSYPLASTRVEESGEHVVIGTGEIACDAIMHDLRMMFAGIEVKVADPVTSFCETVSGSSSIKCFSSTQNKKNRITILAEPLEAGIGEDIEAGAVNIRMDKKVVAEFFQTKYDWDMLSARNIWAFGPTEQGANVLVDDTISGEVDKKLLRSIKDSVIQGFQWGCREGPLCDEPIRNVKFKLLDASIASEPMYRGGGQIIPTARRVGYSAFLLATPKMMEPVYRVEILTPADAVEAVYSVLARRRGHVTSDNPKPGTPFYVVNGFIPVIDSFGFETDLRVHTQGQAFGLQVFDHWAVVPGDPLDKNIVLRPLEPAPPSHLAREFMVKTRRRKGLSEDVSATKYFDEEMIMYLAHQEAIMATQ